MPLKTTLHIIGALMLCEKSKTVLTGIPVEERDIVHQFIASKGEIKEVIELCRSAYGAGCYDNSTMGEEPSETRFNKWLKNNNL